MLPAMASPENPFQILTFIVAPAILTNSSSVLALSTSNRFARVVDRSRALYDKLRAPESLLDSEKSLYQRHLQLLGKRSLLLVKALTCFYGSVGAFAATTLVSLIGAGLSLFHLVLLSDFVLGISLFCGITGVVGLVWGTTILIRETWLAQSFLHAEIQHTEAFCGLPATLLE